MSIARWLPAAAIILALSLGAWNTFGPSVFAATCVLVTAPLVAAVWSDLWTHEHEPWLTYTALAVTTVGLAAAGIHDPVSSLRALCAGLAAFGVLTVVGGLTGIVGYGDVWLATPLIMLVAFQGWVQVFGLAFMTTLTAWPFTMISVVIARSWRARSPLGPPLLVAAVLVLAWV